MDRPAMFSVLEYRVLRFYCMGSNPAAIAQLLGTTRKAVDGALQRVKCKIEFHPVAFYEQYIKTHYPPDRAVELGKALFASPEDYVDRCGRAP